tara:strand:+ start:3695 stop:4684 length:990 start_codon:yes stop_codon:yes gene_type:complete
MDMINRIKNRGLSIVGSITEYANLASTPRGGCGKMPEKYLQSACLMDSACLYIVATPIGNLRDISQRALDILNTVDLIAAEDTRHSGKLLKHYGISTKLMALHEHNEEQRIQFCLDRLQEGQSIALISDAGTPLVSDPGYHLVKNVRESGISVSPIPGASALTAALSCAGLASDAFVFQGFPAAKHSSRIKQLEALRDESRTMVFYEAPHRILETISDMHTVFGPERQAVLAREMTKVHETFLSGKLESLHSQIEADTNQQRGEIVILVEGRDKHQRQQAEEISVNAGHVLDTLLEELPLKQASSLAARITGLKKNQLYQLGLDRKKQQ